MRLDYIIYPRSAISSPKGYLEIQQNGDVTFTKYKEQLEGRMHILAWAAYKAAMALMKDKVILTIPQSEVAKAEVKAGKKGAVFGMVGGAYSEILIADKAGKEHKFYIDPQYDMEKIQGFIKAAQKK